jgi:hypothetical protein
MASWKPKHFSSYVLLINYILYSKFVLDYIFILINYLHFIHADLWYW